MVGECGERGPPSVALRLDDGRTSPCVMMIERLARCKSGRFACHMARTVKAISAPTAAA